MSHLQFVAFCVLLILLVLISAFFSAAETGLMAINRYRLRHKAKMKRRYAMRILKLLKRPDRLLGVILIGNSFSNIMASALATLLAVHFWGEKGAILVSIGLTFIVLIFAEVAPKTLAAIFPEQISKIVAWPISLLLKVLYPLVWLINVASNAVLRLIGINVMDNTVEPLNREELRTVVYETSGRFSHEYQNMLLGILDLNKVTVDDVMIPKHEIIGLDIEWSWEKIQKKLGSSEYDWLPVYRENINQLLGVLHLRDLTKLSLAAAQVNKEALSSILHESYFVPEGTLLNIQLLNFQRLRKRIAFIVDEYGDVKGLVTVVDILEEIVGEFTTTVAPASTLLQVQPDGSYLIEGSITVREFNRLTSWQLPTQGARTLNGLIVEYLEMIPRSGVCVLIAGYPIEITNVKKNRIKMARVFPSLDKQNETS